VLELSKREVEDAVRERLKRQKVLNKTDKSFVMIHSEAVLCNWFCSPAVMAEQIKHTIELVKTDLVEFRIFPFNQNVSVSCGNTFTIQDRFKVSVETATEVLHHWEQEKLDYYESLFARLMDASVTGKAARKILERHLKLARAAS
jgi:formate/nitrite transporter FocA (FNT family)